MAVRTLSTTEAKNQFSAVVNSVADNDETVVVQQHGRAKVAIISAGKLEEYEALAKRERRQKALEQLRTIRSRVRARNLDLTEDQAMELANRFVRETIDEMIAEGKLHYEGYDRETEGEASRRSRHERADQSLAVDGRREHS